MAISPPESALVIPAPGSVPLAVSEGWTRPADTESSENIKSNQIRDEQKISAAYNEMTIHAESNESKTRSTEFQTTEQ